MVPKTLLALLIAWAVFLYAPAQAEVPGDKPIALVGCLDRTHAETFVEVVVESNPQTGDPRFATCRPLMYQISDFGGATMLTEPLTDWEGDVFALWEAPQQDGPVVWLLVWYPNGFQAPGRGA